MHPRRWFSTTPMPIRWAGFGAIALALLAAMYGIGESIRDYPLGSWSGVTLYLTLIGLLGGFLLGLAAGTVALGVRSAAGRRVRP